MTLSVTAKLCCLGVAVSLLQPVISDDSQYVPGLSPTTVWPEICRVYRKASNCSDFKFRQACPHFCSIDCPGQGFVYVGARGLCYATTQQEKAFWSHAQEHCRAYGARLAHMETESDSQVLQYLQILDGTSAQSRMHIGAVNIGVIDEWAWLDGSIFSVGGYFWSRSYPMFMPSNPGCANLNTEDTYKKETNPCNQLMGFVCEQKPNVADLYDDDGLEILEEQKDSVNI